jgi:hypothetical protein
MSWGPLGASNTRCDAIIADFCCERLILMGCQGGVSRRATLSNSTTLSGRETSRESCAGWAYSLPQRILQPDWRITPQVAICSQGETRFIDNRVRGLLTGSRSAPLLALAPIIRAIETNSDSLLCLGIPFAPREYCALVDAEDAALDLPQMTPLLPPDGGPTISQLLLHSRLC